VKAMHVWNPQCSRLASETVACRTRKEMSLYPIGILTSQVLH
jgi:hypothetical protein